jgi:hypothetical protein
MDINTITPLTAQQVFDAALFGIRKQEYVQSYLGGRGCAYRGDSGLKCGIGHAIPDACYDPLFDDNSPSTSIGALLENSRQQFDVLRRLFQDVPLGMLKKLQEAHDRILSPTSTPTDRADWEQRMYNIAARYGVTYTPVAEA